MPTWAIVLICIVGFLLLVFIGWWISTANKFKVMLVKIDEAESGIEVALTKRYDLLTKALASVKGYAKHEDETLSKIVAMRNPGANSTFEEKQEFANKTDAAMKAFNVIVEQYPTLKADTQFSALQARITDVEEQLQAARRLYNANVSKYNQAIIVFPASIIAGNKYVKRAFFEAEEAKREDVKIEF